MSDLELGGGAPANWGIPSPLYNFETGTYDSAGLVWMGEENATLDDMVAAKAYFGENATFDTPTLFGLPSFRERNMDKPAYNQTVVLG